MFSFIFFRQKSPAGVFPTQKPSALITQGNALKNNSRVRCRYNATSVGRVRAAEGTTYNPLRAYGVRRRCCAAPATFATLQTILYRPPELNIILRKWLKHTLPRVVSKLFRGSFYDDRQWNPRLLQTFFFFPETYNLENKWYVFDFYRDHRCNVGFGTNVRRSITDVRTNDSRRRKSEDGLNWK